MKLSQFTPTPTPSFFFLILSATISVAGATVDNDAAVMSSLLKAISPAPTGWSHSTNYCSKWRGVCCSSTGRVTAINLPNLSLTGTLPSNLASLSQLTSLNLKGNCFSGQLPSFANHSVIQEIFLDHNKFASLPVACFQGLTDLRVLTMDNNLNLPQWDFPIEVIESPNLVNLSMVSCNLNGSIPEKFFLSSFPNLQNLFLSSNFLNGVLPQTLPKSKIQKLCLCQNSFTGPIPNLSKLENLFDLQLNDNQFTGLVPISLISLPKLRSVSLKNNLLQGPLPQFNSHVKKVDILGTNSYCRDTLGPCDWQVMVLLEVAKDLGYPSKLADSWRGNDVCKGWNYVKCDSQEKKVEVVNFHKRHFSGKISAAFGKLTELRNLWLNDNKLIGSIPYELTLLPHLLLLNVSYNNLSGKIPKFNNSMVKLITIGNPLLLGNYNDGTSSNATAPVYTVGGGGRNIKPIKVGTGKSRNFMFNVTIAAVASSIGLIIMIILFFCLRKFPIRKSIFFWKKQNPAHRNIEIFLRNCGPLQVRRYSYSEVKKMTNSFKEKLGQGGFGSVYKGKLLQDGSLVAVKMLINESKTTNGEDFINEVATISRTSHVNIVSLLGFCFEGSKKALIYEFMLNGSLEKFIFNENDFNLDWETHYQISLGIARGLEYLHRGCNTRILHFDIKPHNILLDADFVPKISDFGLAKICTRQESVSSMLGPRGTIGYIAPEIISRNFGVISYKSDVYTNNTSEIYFPHWVYRKLELDEEVCLKRINDKEDKIKVKKMIIVSLWCVQANPEKRPSMSKVIEMLEGSVDSLQIPPTPFLSSSSSSSTSPLSSEFSSSAFLI
ncbi:hypothetical protein CsatB_021989 [Cannabis sativa]